ncbi:unnamed protein product [Phytophthora fragariaefolia]|uniref:Unnamed protein product n=1 Tax=Phytophthora fragariaefolia TaxID=1490495 RepID=A0A9W6Y3M7_9STRA|nr:unnamed protein product [Phytophthora fragariaefolia]
MTGWCQVGAIPRGELGNFNLSNPLKFETSPSVWTKSSIQATIRKMPTSSEKKRLLEGPQAVWRNRLLLLVDTEDSSDEDDEMRFASLYVVLQSQRYVAGRKRVERPPRQSCFT